MSQELTPDQKKAKADAHDALIKHVFDNLRNVIICATFAVAGAAVIKHSDKLALGPEVNKTLGFLVLLSAFLLLAWNMIHGIEKVIRPIKGKKKAWLFVPFAVIYMFAVLAVFHAWSMVQAQQLSRGAPNTSVNADAAR